MQYSLKIVEPLTFYEYYFVKNCCAQCCPYDFNPFGVTSSPCVGFAYSDVFGCTRYSEVLSRRPIKGLLATCQGDLGNVLKTELRQS